MQITKVIVANARNGGKLLADTNAYTPTAPLVYWGAIYVVNDAVFTTCTGSVSGIGGSGITFKAGTLIEGKFTAVTLASGAVIVYNGEK